MYTIRAPKPLPILVPNSVVPKNGFPIVSAFRAPKALPIPVSRVMSPKTGYHFSTPKPLPILVPSLAPRNPSQYWFQVMLSPKTVYPSKAPKTLPLLVPSNVPKDGLPVVKASTQNRRNSDFVSPVNAAGYLVDPWDCPSGSTFSPPPPPNLCLPLRGTELLK